MNQQSYLLFDCPFSMANNDTRFLIPRKNCMDSAARKALFLPRGHLGPGHLLLLHAVSRCQPRKIPLHPCLSYSKSQVFDGTSKSIVTKGTTNGIDHDKPLLYEVHMLINHFLGCIPHVACEMINVQVPIHFWRKRL